MGLSKKLGATSQKIGLPASTTVPYKWSTQTYTVEEIVKKFKLPFVVQCATDSCTVVWSDFQFDLRQPLLLYSKRSVQKVHAVSLKQNKDALEEIGPPLAIPEDYEGWFGAAPKGNSRAKRHFRIENVASSTAHRLLVTTKCPAFTSSRDPAGNLQYVPHDVMPGEVLKRVCLMDFDTTHPDCPDLVKIHGPCLEFLDEKGEDVIIPLSHSALTYEIGDNYPDEDTRVFQITSAIEAGNSKLPRIISLIHGDPPLLAYAFTGMVRCYSVFTEETMLAATLEEPGSRCLELATDSCVKFRLCLNEVAVKKTCEYGNAFQMCEGFGAKFITRIKVSFTLKPEMSNAADGDVSFYESASDVQEVEANSEFDIAWGSAKKAKLFTSPGLLGKGIDLRKNDATEAKTEVPSGEIPQQPTEPVSDDHSETDSAISNSDIPRHRDFTEREIVDLMLKKGLMDPAESGNEESSDIDLLTENRVTDNPLFYFLKRNPDQNPLKSVELLSDTSSSDESPEDNTDKSNQENPLLYMFQPAKVPSISNAEVKNPLAYLFEQNLDYVAAGENSSSEVLPGKSGCKGLPDKSGSKVLTDKSTASASFSCLSPEVSCTLLDSDVDTVSDVDVSQYDKVVCRTARVYTGSDEDDDGEDDEDDDDDSSESNETNSEISDISDNIKELNYHKEVDLPQKQVKESTVSQLSGRSFHVINSQVKNSSLFNYVYDDSMGHTNRAYTASSVDDAEMENTCLLDVSVDETDAVVDLLTLAELESHKYSVANVVEHANSQPNSTDNTESNLEESNKVDAVHRLNNLLEEVTELVNISSGRILDANKRPLDLQQNKAVTVSPTKEDVPSPIPRHSKAKRINNYFPTSNEVDFSVPVLTNSHNTLSTDAADTMLLTNHSRSISDKSSPKTGAFKLKLNKANDLNLRHSRLKSEDHMNGLKRAHAELNLVQASQDQIDDVNDLHMMSPTESSISSIFSFVQNQKNSLEESEVSYYPENHTHRQSSKTDYPVNDYSSSSEMNRGEKYAYPYKNQRILSLASGRNVLASVQNFERLSHGSTSSSYSSGLDNSFSQAVPKLVVIGDIGIVMENNHRDHDDLAKIDTQHQTFALPSERGDAGQGNVYAKEVNAKGHYNMSRNGKLRSHRFTLSQEEFLLTQNGDNDLREDYV